MSTKSTKETLNFLDKLIGEKLTFGKMIANIRECDEITQTDFAKILGISRHYLCDIEHDRRNVSVVKAYEYANKLGYSTKQFVQLALQGQIDKVGLNYDVALGIKQKKNIHRNKKFVSASAGIR